MDDKRYALPSFYSRGEPPYYESPRGTLVLVDVHTSMVNGVPRVERKAVPTAHLRGPWESTLAQVEAVQNAERARQAEASERRDRAVAAARQVAERAAREGIRVRLVGGESYGTGSPRFVVSTEEMSRILDLLGEG
ncbi:hypothetical protein AB0L22_09265 [Micromonospora haikouensis]|uniref:hypothetical protein n=1 Tax=Micromonospora haikouensis TaxID=686309 RepID=UPI0034220C21